MTRVVRDYFTNELLDVNRTIRFVNEIVDDIIFYEYTNQIDKLVNIVDRKGERWYNKDNFEKDIIFDKSNGYYKLKSMLDLRGLVYSEYGSTSGYNYTFNKVYGANKHLRLFKDKQELINPEVDYKLSRYLKYTIGVEFETAMGILPEDICFRDGLIPLRDGSITGNEYSSVILEGNAGLNLLKQEVDTLKSYTFFDKNCSLHIHLGNIPLNTTFLYNIYKICVSLQDYLESILPRYTFRSSCYKNTGKDYCNKLPKNLKSFEELYRYMVGIPYFGDLNQPHPDDVVREHKWNIHQRYFFVNFINALCYKTGKTIEFRFLRPTYNFNKIMFWLYIFNAILIAGESDFIPSNLEHLVCHVYPEDIAKDLMKNIVKVALCSDIQTRIDDNIGARTDIEDRIFDTTELL